MHHQAGYMSTLHKSVWHLTNFSIAIDTQTMCATDVQ